jgi:hypothetical protein
LLASLQIKAAAWWQIEELQLLQLAPPAMNASFNTSSHCFCSSNTELLSQNGDESTV